MRKCLRLTRSKSRAEEFRTQGLQPILGDVTQPETLEPLRNLNGVETVLYAVGFDRASGLSQREVYVEGLNHALAAVASRAGQWIYISSTSVYGQDDGEWIQEDSPCEPTKDNGKVCLEAEQLLAKGYPKGANILRLAGIYGPGRLLRRVSDLKAGTPLSRNPEGWLNLIHIEDAVQTVLACAEKGEMGTRYLVSDDRPIQRRDYYTHLAELAGARVPEFELPKDFDPTSGMGKRCSNVKLRGELCPKFLFPTIFQGLPDAIEPMIDK